MAGIDLSISERDISRIVEAVIQLAQGRSNAAGQVTLRANQTTTVVTKLVDKAAVNMSLTSKVAIEPLTANAAAARATTYISARGQGTFTISHASNAQNDRSFMFIISGG